MHSVETPPTGTPSREQVAARINYAMTRFPLILEILDELSGSGCPGDDELRHGCERCITMMLATLAAIEPACPSHEGPQRQEQVALSWLLGQKPRVLIDHVRLDRLDQFIRRLLPQPQNAR